MRKNKFFKPTVISFQEYCNDLLPQAKQGNPRAQYELALLSFGDIQLLSSMRQDVNFTGVQEEVNYNAAFDWLELSVKNKSKDAIAYFQYRQLGEQDFQAEYLCFKHKKENTVLGKYEENITLSEAKGPYW